MGGPSISVEAPMHTFLKFKEGNLNAVIKSVDIFFPQSGLFGSPNIRS